ncbi:hypothetical protein ABIA45_002898 [Bradyrhizobium sp. USDA 336]
MLAIGTMVIAAPAPKPAAVAPAARPRRSGNQFQRVADAGAVHGTRAHAADDRRRIEHGEAVGGGVEDPGQCDHHAAEHDDDARAVFVDEPGLDRHQPGLGDDEIGEGELDRGAPPVVGGIDRIDEQRPAILQIGDHRHADDAHAELEPAETGAKRRGGGGAARAGNHREPPKPPDCL